MCGMSDAPYIKLQVDPFWQRLQNDLVRIVELVPDDKMDWTPRSELWNFRGILIHVSDVRDYWLANGVQDGEPYPNIWQTARSKDDLKRELVRTFERLTRFLNDRAQLDAQKPDPADASRPRDGHWLAFQLLEHDIHHRSELMQRLALLGIAHGIEL